MAYYGNNVSDRVNPHLSKLDYYLRKESDIMSSAESKRMQKMLNCIDWKNVFIDGELTPYQVSDVGIIRNRDTHIVVKGIINKQGYVTVIMRIKDRMRTKFLHMIVARAYLENPNNKPVAIHKDGNKENNCVSNLKWVDYDEIQDEKLLEEIKSFEENNAMSNVYTDKQVHEVCRLLEEGKSMRWIATNLGVNINLPYRILYMGKWRDIASQYKLPPSARLMKMKQEISNLMKSGLRTPDEILQAMKICKNRYEAKFILNIIKEMQRGNNQV